MPAFSGKDLDVQWIYSGGTIALNGDYRQLSYNTTSDLIEQTAGADAVKTYLPSLKDSQIQLTVIAQAAGTALLDALVDGGQGTLLISPEGTSTGKRKITVPAIVQSRNVNEPYNDVVDVQVTFQGNGAISNAAN